MSGTRGTEEEVEVLLPTEPLPTKPAVSLKQQAMRGTLWTSLGYGGSQAIRLVNNVILARLLTPELFGLMALVHMFLQGLTLFSDLGTGVSLIQNERGAEKNFRNTAWTLQVIRGTGLWAAAALIAWPVSVFYKQPTLFPLLIVCGFSAFLAGLNSTSLPLLTKRLQLGRLTQIEISTQLITSTVVIIWAYFYPNVWALAGGTIVGAGVKFVWSHAVAGKESNRIAWDKESLGELIRFGRWIFISTAVTFLAGQADKLILGKLLDIATLGVYSVALNFARMPEQLIKQVSGKVIFPLLAQEKDRPRAELRSKFLRHRRKILAVLGLGIAVGTALGDVPIRLLYSAEYQQAAWMLPMLSCGMWINSMTNSTGPVVLALGKPNYTAMATGTRFLYIAAGLPLSYYFFGLPGAVLFLALSELPVYVVQQIGLQKLRVGCAKQDFQFTLAVVALGALLIAARMALGFGTPFSGWLTAS